MVDLVLCQTLKLRMSLNLFPEFFLAIQNAHVFPSNCPDGQDYMHQFFCFQHSFCVLCNHRKVNQTGWYTKILTITWNIICNVFSFNFGNTWAHFTYQAAYCVPRLKNSACTILLCYCTSFRKHSEFMALYYLWSPLVLGASENSVHSKTFLPPMLRSNKSIIHVYIP